MTGAEQLFAIDEAIERSAAPGAVRVALDRLEDAHPGVRTRMLDDEGLRAAITAVTAASRSLTMVLQTDEGAVDVLADLDTPLPTPPLDPGGDAEAEAEAELRRWKQLELLRIAARDLLELDRLDDTGDALAALARGVLAGATRLVGGPPMAVIGMGKLGGRELNYSSDIDVMFVGEADTDGERVAREIMRIARTCFRVDANLRPEGRDGRLVRTVEGYEAYWERWAQPWEFQALLKARWAAGDRDLGAAFDTSAAAHLWDRTFDADDLRSLRTMKERTEQEMARKGMAERDLKRAAGGIRDVEFSIQLLQLVHGRHDPVLRSPGTLPALRELSSAGYVAPDDAADLEEAYRFLRAVEHRVQLVDEQQVHAVPNDPVARARLARVVGLRDRPDDDALGQFDETLARHRGQVRSIHERLYFRPLLEAFSGAEGLTPGAVETRLAAFGFSDADRTRQAVQELTRGLTRSSRLMRQLLPLLLGWLSDSPDPDLGLLGLRTLASGTQRSQELARAFRESPETARRLCCLLGTSRLLGDALHHNPDLIPDLGSDAALEPRSRHELVERMERKTRLRPDLAGRGASLKRAKEREVLRIAARDLLDLAGVDATAADLTALAEAVLHSAVETLDPQVPVTVIAMGRFGGGELSYASDLDLVLAFDGAGSGAVEEAERFASALLRFVGGATPSARIYEVDADLRPEGRQGPLARSLEGFATYFERWAQAWERQAMLRARPVAGDPDLGRRFMDLIGPHVLRDELPADDVREIRRIKARVERERIPAGDDPQFHLKLGKGSLSDVEFCVQLLQLQHGVAAQGTMQALARLAAADVLDHSDTEVLADAYRFCERTRNRWYLIKGAPGDSLPSQTDQLRRLARSLDTTPVELREQYRRVTRRARLVFERRFYESDRPGAVTP